MTKWRPTVLALLLGSLGFTSTLAQADDRLGTAHGYSARVLPDLAVAGPTRDEGSVVYVAYQFGNNVTDRFYSSEQDQLLEAGPLCWWHVKYSNDDFFEKIDHGTYPVLYTPADVPVIDLEVWNTAGDWESGHPFRVTQVDFAFKLPVSLARRGHKSSGSYITGLTCRGKDLQNADVASAFGERISFSVMP